MCTTFYTLDTCADSVVAGTSVVVSSSSSLNLENTREPFNLKTDIHQLKLEKPFKHSFLFKLYVN